MENGQEVAPLAIHSIYPILTILTHMLPICCNNLSHVYIPPIPCVYAPHTLFTHLALVCTSSTETYCFCVSCCMNRHNTCTIECSQWIWKAYLIMFARSNRTCSEENCKANLEVQLLTKGVAGSEKGLLQIVQLLERSSHYQPGWQLSKLQCIVWLSCVTCPKWERLCNHAIDNDFLNHLNGPVRRNIFY